MSADFLFVNKSQQNEDDNGMPSFAPDSHSTEMNFAARVTGASRKVWPRRIPAVKFESETIACQPRSDWHNARILAMLLINPSQQVLSPSANSISKFMM
jgi:hypothetical protein